MPPALILSSPGSDIAIECSAIFSNPRERTIKMHIYFMALQTLKVLHCRSWEGSLPVSHLQRPSRWDGWWAVGNSPIRGGMPRGVGRLSGPLREKRPDARMGKREGNFTKCALIMSLNLISTTLESAPLCYQSCRRKIPSQAGFCSTCFTLHWTSEDSQCLRDWGKLHMDFHPTWSVIFGGMSLLKGLLFSLNYWVIIR